MTKHTPYSPKPIIMDALPAGAQNAQQASHMKQLEANQKQVNMNKMHGGTFCPQAPMFGMSSSTSDGNALSCAANGTQAQRHSNAQYDQMVGKVATGGRRKRKNSKRKHTYKRNRKTKRNMRKGGSNKRMNLKKSTTQKKKSHKSRK